MKDLNPEILITPEETLIIGKDEVLHLKPVEIEVSINGMGVGINELIDHWIKGKAK